MDTENNGRVILLKLQDRLTDDDRRRLHFFFGNDIPRRIRDDPSLGGTLSLVESLFDQDIINEQDFTVLIKAFDEIKCCDAANILRNYMKKINHSEEEKELASLASILPISVENAKTEEQDKFNALRTFPSDAIRYLSEENHDIPQKSFGLSSVKLVPKSTGEKFREAYRIIKKCFPYLTIFLIITLSIVVSFFIEQNNRVKELTKKVHANDQLIRYFETEANKSSTTMNILRNRIDEIDRDLNNSLIRAGAKFGGTGGSPFDDSLLKNFSCSFYIRGLVVSRNGLVMEWMKFLYSSKDEPDVIIESDLLGQQNQGSVEEKFILHPDERVNKVQLKIQTLDLIVNGVKKASVIVRGVRLMTTKGRASRFIQDDEGHLTTEEFDGYTLGYARGRRGLYVDQIQFFWYRTIFD